MPEQLRLPPRRSFVVLMSWGLGVGVTRWGGYGRR